MLNKLIDLRTDQHFGSFNSLEALFPLDLQDEETPQFSGIGVTVTCTFLLNAAASATYLIPSIAFEPAALPSGWRNTYKSYSHLWATAWPDDQPVIAVCIITAIQSSFCSVQFDIAMDPRGYYKLYIKKWLYKFTAVAIKRLCSINDMPEYRERMPLDLKQSCIAEHRNERVILCMIKLRKHDPENFMTSHTVVDKKNKFLVGDIKESEEPANFTLPEHVKRRKRLVQEDNPMPLQQRTAVLLEK